jgi:MoxR-like ATPase
MNTLMKMALCVLMATPVLGRAKVDGFLPTPTFHEVDSAKCESLLGDPSVVRQDVIRLIDSMGAKVLGMRDVVERSVITVLLGGHILLEGAPGLSKSRLVRFLAQGFSGTYQRVQFVPDLMPADILGSVTYDRKSGEDRFKPGPIFHNFLMADELNRAMTRVQSGLLQAMEEKQVTVDGTTYALPKVFTVMATQNPSEQKGTFPLPEAQLDRFLLRLRLEFPDLETEREILKLVNEEANTAILGKSDSEFKPIALENVLAARSFILNTELPKNVETYILHLIASTRKPGDYVPNMASFIDAGAGPRATVALANSARALAWLRGKPAVTFAEVDALLLDTLAHRVQLNKAVVNSQNLSADQVLLKLAEAVRARLGFNGGAPQVNAAPAPVEAAASTTESERPEPKKGWWDWKKKK